MLIPRFWAKAEQMVASPEGFDYQLRSWGCSPASHADAQADAQRRLAALVARIRQGYHPENLYPYRVSLLREQLLHELPGPRGEPSAIVTRNRYGSLVLNTAGALFLDIDLPADTLLRRLLGLLRGSSATLEDRVLKRLRDVLTASNRGGFRIYRTAAGFRALATGRLFEPGGRESEELMHAARVDRAFIALCRVQHSFRARLTPKPWRIGQPIPHIVYPFEHPDAEPAFQAWLREYDAACAGYAACRLIEQIGPETAHPEIQPIRELHDLATRASSGLPLA